MTATDKEALRAMLTKAITASVSVSFVNVATGKALNARDTERQRRAIIARAVEQMVEEDK